MPPEINGPKFAAELTRMSERRSLDSLDVDRACDVVRELKRYVGRFGVRNGPLVKIARAIVERRISPTRVAEIIETLFWRLNDQREHNLTKDDPQYIANPGGYFMSSIKSEFGKAHLDWTRPDYGEED